MVRVTSKSGTAKVEKGNFGKSSTGRTIKTKITLGSGSSGNTSKRSSSKKSSSSSPNFKLSNGQVTDKKTGRSVNISDYGGNLSAAIQELKDPILKQGTVGGKIYENVRSSEVLKNKLEKFTTAKELPEKTAQRQLAKTSLERLNKGIGTSADLLNVISGGRGEANIINKRNIAVNLINRNEAQRFRRSVYTQLNQDQKRFYENLPASDKDSYLVSVATRKASPIQKLVKKPEMHKGRELSDMSKSVRRILEGWANKINTRSESAKQRQAEREAKQLASNFARKELIEYLPTGTKTLGKGLNALINLGEKTFTGSLSFGEQLASAGEKAVFLLPALGVAVGSGTIGKFGKEFVTPEQKAVLKEIYFDPKTYRDALIGAGVSTILGGVKGRKFTAKEVKKLPRTTTKYKPKSILRDPRGNTAYVTKSGVVKPIPKGFETIIRALTRDVKEFAIRRVTKFPKTTTAKVGTVFRNAKGELRVANKQGRVVKLPKESMRRDLVYAYKKGFGKRANRTLKAREAKARAKRGLTKKELKAQQNKILDKQINKEISQILKRYKINPKDRVAFKKAYKKFRTKQTKASANKLQKLADKFETDKGVKAIDRIIKNRLKKPIKKEVSKKKPIKRPKPTEKELLSADRFQARLKADTQARKAGFENYKEQFRYEQTFKKYKQGQKGAEKVLRNIEKKMAKRKAKASKIASKRFEEFRNRLVKNAIKDLKAGKITIKEQRYKVIRKRPQLPKKEVERIALAVDARQNKIDDIRYKRQAKSALKDIVEGKQIRVSDPKLNSAIRRLLNKEQIKLLRDKKLYDIAKGKIKGKSPKVRLSKTAKKEIRAKSKESLRQSRLERKKQKRSLAGDKQDRKIRRKITIEKEAKKLLKEIIEGKKITTTSPKIERMAIKLLKEGKSGLVKITKKAKPFKVKLAKDILKPSKLKKGDVVKVNKDGTIQVLKTKTKKVLKQRQKSLKQQNKNIQQSSKQKLKLKQKVKTKPKTKQVLRKTSIVKGKTPTSAIRSASAIASGLSRILKSTVKSGIESKNKTISDIRQDIKPIFKQIKIVSNDLDKLQDLDLTQPQDKAINQIRENIQDDITDSKKLLEQVQKTKTTKKTLPKKPEEPLMPVLPKLPKLNWNTKLPKGYNLIVNARYKKGNKIITRILKTTPNRARKIMNKFIDNNPRVSYDLVVVGARKVKDIKKPSIKKFTVKKGKDPKVRINVEKKKFRIDKPGEKSGLKINKLIKRSKNAKKTKSSKIRKKSSKNGSRRKKGK